MIKRTLLTLAIFSLAISTHTVEASAPKISEKNSKYNQLACKNLDVKKPFFNSIKPYQFKKSGFFETNIGVGFLYFSGVEGNLSGQPAIDIRPWLYTPLKGKLTYNKTPVYEFSLGYQFNDWFKLALSYQHQGCVTVQSKMLHSLNPSAAIQSTNELSQFQSQLALDTILAKFKFELPYGMVFRRIVTNPYLAVAVGPGWQTWNRIVVERQFQGPVFMSEPQFLRQKISANAVWMLDAGFKMKAACPDSIISIVLGCKYTAWGQARSMGKITQQDTYKKGLIHPIHIKNVYSFSPYIGLQWSFETCIENSRPIVLKNHDLQTSNKLFFADIRPTRALSGTMFAVNVGPGFLYYSGIKGNLFGQPSTNFGTWGSVKLEDKITYNKTPLFEALWLYQINPWVKTGLSFQNQSGVVFQTKILNAQSLAGEGNSNDYSQFQSNLSLNSVMLKAYFQLPFGMIFKSIATTPYFAVGVGPGWQTWSRVHVNRFDDDTVGYNADPQPIHQKISANAVWMLDAGFQVKSLNRHNSFSMMLGCKFNDWGQARNIGKLSQQDNLRKGLVHPFRIKMVYSFAPYIGVQWFFPVKYNACKPYMINGRSISSKKPFYTLAGNIQSPSNMIAQFNIGVGFLYFSSVAGALTGQPSTSYTNYGPVPLENSMTYNRTPLYEYLLGYRFNNLFSLALAYQHQAGIVFQTRTLNAYASPVAPSAGAQKSQLSSNVNLDALTLKMQLELPWAFIWKTIASTPYFAAGVGPGWQTWSNIDCNRMFDDNVFSEFVAEPQSLRQKISANAVWLLDAGLRFQGAEPTTEFSFLLGCKFIGWGQARSIGKVSQQDGIREGLADPFRIRMVYSFAPYLGMQWNF